MNTGNSLTPSQTFLLERKFVDSTNLSFRASQRIVGETRNPGKRQNVESFWIPRLLQRGMTDCDTACEEMPSAGRQAWPVLDTGVEVRII